jgi:hypothetical protein
MGTTGCTPKLFAQKIFVRDVLVSGAGEKTFTNRKVLSLGFVTDLERGSFDSQNKNAETKFDFSILILTIVTCLFGVLIVHGACVNDPKFVVMENKSVFWNCDNTGDQ